jgi:hypothetical protein
VRSPRRCSRSACPNAAVATLTYVYADSTAVVGPLSVSEEPHTYDLCEVHALRVTVPRGWDLVRHEGDYTVPSPTSDDLVALADAVREAGRPARRDGTDQDPGRDLGRRGHLRVIPPPA